MKKTQALINELLVDVFNHILSIEEAELIKAESNCRLTKFIS